MNPADDSPGAGPAPVSACPRCGSSSAHPFSTVGVCLRCAGERVLAFADTPEPDPSGPGLGDIRRGSDDLPVRIGPYEIIEELGRGGMGCVYAARQTGLGRIVALKVLREGEGGVAGLELRFLREAQTVARLRHPNIVNVHDSGRADGYVYFSMDYIDGGDLARRLRAEAVPPREATLLVQKIAAALACTHAEGVLHRDIKPSNILLDGDEPKLADFGLAAQLEPGGDLTLRSGVLGTPHYVAPEALRGGSAALSAASDLYALGIVLYELLTGRTPFAGAAPAELASLLDRAEVPSPRLLAPLVPRDLETICLTCLQAEPARRYASAAALADDLRRFLAGEPILARPPSAGERAWRWCRRRPALALTALLVTTIAVGSTLAAGRIARERARTEQALAAARSSEAAARDSLREAKLAEARAVRRTPDPGRRAQALAAIAAAAKIRPGVELRDEAVAALMQPDLRVAARWDLQLGVPGQITFAPDGSVVAVELRSATGMARSPAALHRWGEAKPWVVLEPPAAAIIGPQRFSADAKLLMARYADDTLRVWRVGEAKPYLTIGDQPPPSGRALGEIYNDDYDFSPDGTRIALGLAGGGVALRRAADGIETARWTGGETFSSVRFSPDGGRLAAVRLSSYDERRIYVLDAATGGLERVLTLPTAPNQLAWTADGRILAVSLVDNSIIGFDAGSGLVVQRMACAARDLWAISFVASDRLLAQRGAGTNLYLSNFDLGREELEVPGAGPGLIAAQPGRPSLLVASVDGVATRWELESAVGFRVLPPPRIGDYDLSVDGGSGDFSPDGRWAATGHGRFTLVRELATGRPVEELDLGVKPVDDYCGLAFSADGGALLRGSSKSGLQRYPIRRDATPVLGPAEPLDAETGFTIVAHSADRRRLLLLDYDGGRVKVLDLTRDGRGARVTSRWEEAGAYGGAFSPDGETVLLNCTGLGPQGAAQRLRLHRASDGAVVRELEAPVSCEVAWSADGRTVLTSDGQDFSILWDAATWTRRAEFHGALGGNVTTFALSEDSAYAVVANDDKLTVLSARDGSRLAAWRAPVASGLATAIRFLPGTHEFAVLWRDGRIDCFDLDALDAGLAQLGLAW